MVGFASKVSGILRDSIVMYPVFSVAQVPQDSFAAMFSSGLKPQYALRIPMLAIKEFIQTLRGKSTTHEKLKSFGVSGLFDSTAESIRKNFEDSYGLSSNPSLKNRVRKILGDIATASDNSVRQAVYEASLQQGLSEAEAIEKSFEIFNPHRRGTSKELAIASKLIPFFNAYIAVQHVAYKTLTGKGVSPSQREEALKTLAATSTSVFLMSFLYAALNADDDDYLRKPTPTRDRLLMIPRHGRCKYSNSFGHVLAAKDLGRACLFADDGQRLRRPGQVPCIHVERLDGGRHQPNSAASSHKANR